MSFESFRAAALAALVACAGNLAAAEPRPDALLVVDMHRQAIVERTVTAWPEHIAAERVEALRKTLWGLRADRLLAVSLSPGLDGLLAVLGTAERVDTAVHEATVSTKALGDPVADLVYSPLTPCRIVDTRNAVGALIANTTRTLLGYHVSTFASQGGTATSCGIPNGVAALAMNVYAVNPSNLGFIKLWASNQTEPAVSTVNYEPPTVAIATGAIVPVNATDSNKFFAKSPAAVHLVVDVVGYFRSVTAPGAGLRITRHATLDTVNAINGSSENFVLNGVRGATIAGGGLPIGDPDGDFTFSGPNSATDAYATVGGGFANQAGDGLGTVIDASFATVGGGRNNLAGGYASTVTGGYSSWAAGAYSFIGGGSGNLANKSFAAITGGAQNEATGDASHVGGGSSNVASGNYSTIAGGSNSSATGHNAVISGGSNNLASNSLASIAGGTYNLASGMYSFVGGGNQNNASGSASSIAGGEANAATGTHSFAAGRLAWANQNRCAIFGLWSTGTPMTCLGSTEVFRIGADHGFSVDYFSQRLDGGGNRWVYIGDIFAGRTINAWNGAHLTDAGVWVNGSSSAATKIDFAPVDAEVVLDRVVAMPVTTWRYKEGEAGVRHIGPMAEDFHAAFGVGYGPHTIADLDARGVAFAAIQGLAARLQARDREIAALKQELARLARAVWETDAAAR